MFLKYIGLLLLISQLGKTNRSFVNIQPKLYPLFEHIFMSQIFIGNNPIQTEIIRLTHICKLSLLLPQTNQQPFSKRVVELSNSYFGLKRSCCSKLIAIDCLLRNRRFNNISVSSIIQTEECDSYLLDPKKRCDLSFKYAYYKLFLNN